MIVGLFSNQKRTFPIAEHFCVQNVWPDQQGLYFLAASFQNDTSFHYDILHVCSVATDKCVTNVTTVDQIIIESVKLHGTKTKFTTSAKTIYISNVSLMVTYGSEMTKHGKDPTVTVASRIFRVHNLTVQPLQKNFKQYYL